MADMPMDWKTMLRIPKAMSLGVGKVADLAKVGGSGVRREGREVVLGDVSNH